MSRIARVVVPEIPHHIVQRGNRRQQVFFNDNDRLLYLSLLAENARKYEVSIWAYSLMINHVHIIAVPHTVKGLAKAIGDTHRSYTIRINRRKGWGGYLWQGRFFSNPMDERYLYAGVRYVERNSVRANIVEFAEDYPWSSAAAHVLGRMDPVLSGDEVQAMNIDDWKAYVRDVENEETLEALRRSIKSGRPIGSEKFIEEIEAKTGLKFN